jgi:lysophospholipase L1-like esterase
MKTLLINIAVFCTLWVVVHLALIAGNDALKYLGSKESKANLPNYAAHDWAAKHFSEFGEQEYQYRSFLGWRRLPYSGETINIDEKGVRRTVDQTPNDAKKKVFFFGGSTIWGTGVSDEFTIPSKFASITSDYQVSNYGEAAYTAHQSLEMLINLIQAGERPDVVIFYDGVNDVKYKCRKKHSWYSHSWEDHYVPRFELYDSVFSFDYALGTLRTAGIRLKAAIKQRLDGGAKTYNCHEDQKKAERIAAALVQDWKIVQMIVESNGGQFFPFLQPVSYFSRTRLDRISVSEELRRQFELIYPMIKREAESLRGFHDLTELFDRNEYIYVDYAHVSPNGNSYAAERILSVIEARQGPSAAD